MDEHRGGNDAFTGQGTPRIVGEHQQLEESSHIAFQGAAMNEPQSDVMDPLLNQETFSDV